MYNVPPYECYMYNLFTEYYNPISKNEACFANLSDFASLVCIPSWNVLTYVNFHSEYVLTQVYLPLLNTNDVMKRE